MLYLYVSPRGFCNERHIEAFDNKKQLDKRCEKVINDPNGFAFEIEADKAKEVSDVATYVKDGFLSYIEIE